MRRHVCSSMIALFAILAGTPLFAQGVYDEIIAETEKQRPEARQVSRIGGELYQRLLDVEAMIVAEEYALALTELKSIQSRRMNDNEVVAVWQLFGYVHGSLENHEESISYYEKALAVGVLSSAQYQAILYSIAHLHAALEDFEQAIETMKDWFLHEPEPSADAFMFMGSSYAALVDYENALPFVLHAIEASEIPNESWYQMATGLYFALEQFEESLPILKAMVTYWSRKPRYWEVLAGVYQNLGNERAALDTMMTAYINGMVTDSDRILSLVQLNLVHENPYVAASILENEMIAGVVTEDIHTVEMLIQIWTTAREYDRAIAAIDRAIRITEAAPYHMRASRLHTQSGQWAEAAARAQAALDAGAKRPIEALLIIGTACSELGRYEESLQAFRRITETGTAQERENAELWIGYVEDSRDYASLVSTAQ